ncbi:acyltransferase domain-containing protein [Nocardia sp. NPDC050712]|uniref:type I polyketide synthase n=1 Tax=Nocardia sp. NPDC050712 TaxID=3155518 RepID=UPI0033F10C2A
MTTDDRLREYLKRATTELQQTKRRLRRLEAQQTEPIAIVGMACRLPGGVGSPEDLWRLLSEGANVAAEYPRDRGWDEFIELVTRGNRPPGLALPGGYLYEATEFDADFFGISPREAATISPQQRVLLEVAWEAVERAGIDPAALRGRAVGVFAGINNEDYGTMVMLSGADIVHFSTSCAPSVLSGRVSYFLGLEGPSVTVDTACSASLVTLQLAVNSLRAGECELALAGGSTVMATPTTILGFAANQGLSSDGRCKSFSDAADGVGWGEGAGMLALERLSDAQRNGHRVLAVVRGVAVNSDGASNGLTAPNGPSQQRVIRQALQNAKVTAAEVDVVEAHGTGTALGDPIEAQALLATYGQERDRPLWLGSIKSNIGHTQAAAGVAGVMKMVLAMQHEMLPRSLYAESPSSKIDWSAGAVELLADPQPWPAGERVRRAAVSSFGISGTNAHVILEEAPPEPAVEPVDAHSVPSIIPWVLSARNRPALRAVAQRLAELPADVDPVDIGLALLRTRTLFETRAVVVGADRDELLVGLRAVADGGFADNVVTGAVRPGRGDTVFVFPGQGTQWPGMARELLATSAVFTAALADCEKALAPFVDWSLSAVLQEADGAPTLDRVDVVQPVLFAVMVSLAAVWKSLGVTPDVVVGHSQGEIAAACVAGGLSLADAARVVARRSQALVRLSGQGAMLAVSLPRTELARRLERWAGRLSVAAVNGPRDTIVSGAVDATDELAESLAAEGVRCRRIAVDYAAHSAQVDLVREELLTQLRDIEPRSGSIALWSTVTGGWLDTTRLDAQYWYRNLREPVELEQAVRGLAAQSAVFLEVGPHPVLAIGMESTLEDAGLDVPVVATLRRDNGGLRQLAGAAGRIFVHGVPVAWDAFCAWPAPHRVDLPLYPFQREPYWLMPTVTIDGSQLEEEGTVAHPMLGKAVPVPGSDMVALEGLLSFARQPWLNGHEMLGRTMLPGTGLVELALEAGAQVGHPHLDELVIEAPLVISDEGTSARIQLQPSGPGYAFTIYARPAGAAPDQGWIRQAAGRLSSAVPEPDPAEFEDFATWPPTAATSIEIGDLHDRLTAEGYGFPPAFRGLRAAWQRGAEMFAEVALPAPEHRTAERFRIHPALLDAAMHVMIAGAAGMVADGMIVGFLWADATLYRTGAEAIRVRITGGATGPSGNAVSLAIADEQGRPVGAIGSVVGRPISRRQLAAAFRVQSSRLYEVGWQPAVLRSAPRPARWAAVGCTAETLGRLPFEPAWTADTMAELAARLDSADARPDIVLLDDDAELRSSETWGGLDCFASSRIGLVGGPDTALPGAFGRFTLVQVSDAWELMPWLAAIDEPELRLRDGTVSVRRLARVGDTDRQAPPNTPATVVLGGAVEWPVVEHLVRERGVDRIRYLARDEADRQAVRDRLAGYGAQVEFGSWAEPGPGAETAFSLFYFTGSDSPAADSEFWALHEVPGSTELTVFVPADGLRDGPEYQAARGIRVSAEALAARCRAAGKSARVVCLGPATGEELYGALDLVYATDLPVVAAGLDLETAGADPLFRNLARASAAPAAEVAVDYGHWTAAVSGLGAKERGAALLALVHREVAATLGHASPDSVSPDRLFEELGVESLAAMEIRERVSHGSGVRMPVTLIFDYQTCRAVAGYIESRMFPAVAEAEESLR